MLKLLDLVLAKNMMLIIYTYNGINNLNMKPYILLLLLLLFGTACQQQPDKKTENNSDSILTNGMIDDFIISYEKVDSIARNKLCSSLKLNYSDEDTLHLELLYDADHIYKLTYPQFDVVGDFKGYESFYFDNNIPFGQSTRDQFVFFNINKGEFYSPLSLTKVSTQPTSFNGFKNADLQCEVVKSIDALTHKFSTLSKYKPIECINTRPDFKTIVDSVPLYKSPYANAGVIKYLQKNTLFKYVKADVKNKTINNLESYFIQVRLEKDSGWVFFSYNDIFSLDQSDGPEKH
jgi:hypothetical protein